VPAVTVIEHIARLLERHQAELTVGKLAVPPPQRLEEAVDRVRRRFGSGPSVVVRRDRVREAIQRLRREGVAGLRRCDRFALAYGLAQPATELDGRTLLEDEHVCGPLLEAWSAEARSSRMRPLHWRGLFHSYMQAPDADGTEKLRALLRTSMPQIIAHYWGRPPPWLEVAERHQALLERNPCGPYVEELAAGRRDRFDDLCSELRPQDASWFWSELVSALLARLSHMGAVELKSRIPFVLQLANEIRTRRDAILAGILDQYAARSDRERSEDLLSYAIDAWGSPQLVRNLKWNSVRPETRRMVCGWLAQEDLEDFYRLCQDERRVDDRRLKFWLRYKDQIGFSQIVLGSRLFASRDPDVREFRERKKGRLARLISGSATNNAIIMQIGSYVFVEFSEKGNACYVYRVRELPFEIGRESYALSELRRRGGTRLLHIGSWERERFAPALARRGIVPDAQETAGSVSLSRDAV